ncbi:DUF7666 domain-containing protein [Treponema pectinovorum]|uniref:DUF7666 domain-containing protein n=1 Tax=Treponema pectinovorum TaxID=164 RepID=UPI0011CC6E71|nr:hypothetical protein [Treponema pectinovorum]
MKAYKGFDKDFKCKDFQYEVGKTYEMDEKDVEVCECGFHACLNPFDVLYYYDFEDGHRFCEVEVEGKIDETNFDSKVACSKITITKELTLEEFIKAMIDFSLVKSKDNNSIINTLCSARVASKEAHITIGSSGIFTQIASSGECAKIGSSGNYETIASSGRYTQIASSGDYAAIAAGGRYTQITSGGANAQIASSGCGTQIVSTGDDCVICCAGEDSKARAKVGSWITLSEWGFSEEKHKYVPICVKTEYVDGERIKGDTWYVLKYGEFREV